MANEYTSTYVDLYCKYMYWHVRVYSYSIQFYKCDTYSFCKLPNISSYSIKAWDFSSNRYLIQQRRRCRRWRCSSACRGQFVTAHSGGAFSTWPAAPVLSSRTPSCVCWNSRPHTAIALSPASTIRVSSSRTHSIPYEIIAGIYCSRTSFQILLDNTFHHYCTVQNFWHQLFTSQHLITILLVRHYTSTVNKIIYSQFLICSRP